METASWAGFAMAALSLWGTVLANVNTRKANKDKLDHEVKLKEIETDAKRKDEDLAELRELLRDCRKQHEDSEEDRRELNRRMAASEEDRRKLAQKLEELEKQVATKL